jgi:CBS domain containing-hemolysin-like protein
LVDPLQIGFLSVLVGLSAFFAGSETALVSLSEIKAKSLMEQKKRGGRVLYRLKQKPKRLIITILIGNNLVNVGAAALATIIATETFGSTGIGIATGAMTLVILVFGDITPKSYATVHNERLSLIVARPIEILSYILLPLVLPLEKLSDFLTRAPSDLAPTVTEADLKTMIEVGEEEKVIEKHEKEFMTGVLKSGEITAREAMTPRLRMFVLESNLTVRGAIAELVKKRFSRAPIIKGSRDKVVGIVRLKELLVADSKGKGNLRVTEISAPPLFVSQKEIVGNLLRELQIKRQHMAIVVDEFGGVEGLLTLEDLIEEIVGEIADETEASPRVIRRSGRNSIVVHGDTEIHDVERFFNIDLPRETDSSTINGLLHDLLKDLPTEGDKIDLEDLTLSVEEVRENRPYTVRITKATRNESKEHPEGQIPQQLQREK